MRHISILGSTGSIGVQALEVIAAKPDCFCVDGLAAYENDCLMEEQMEIFKPKLAVLTDKAAAERLRRRYRGKTEIMTGEEGLQAVATLPPTQMVLTAMVGFAGLKPTVAAIEAGKNIALANKETLVAAGEFVTALAKEKKVMLLPVDSEHSAIFQCLNGENSKQISRLLITASGGPFRGFDLERLAKVSVSECLRHPNWSMGRKITVDSATLVNKGLEVMEARWLFGVNYEQIDVCVHPQSIVHSMVEFVDGSIIAQMGMPDMRLPIQYAFTYPERLSAKFPRLDFTKAHQLDFVPPDMETFRALPLAYEVGRKGGTMPCVFNGANEAAVAAFLREEIRFLDIVTVLEEVLSRHQQVARPLLADILAANEWALQKAGEVISYLRRSTC